MNSTQLHVGGSASRGGGADTTTSMAGGYEQSRRQISSVIVSEQVLGDVPQSGGVRYVEVPVVEEVVRHVPKREVVEVEKIVPRYEVEWVEQEVSVPQIVYLDRPVEREHVQEVIRQVPGAKTVQEVPREVIRHVPKVEYVQVEKIVQVPGQVVEVPKAVVVERPIPVKRSTDVKVPVVVAQTIRPVVTESPDVIDVDVYEYEPEVIPVDVHVPKPVSSHLVAVGSTEEVHHEVMVPTAQYNTILRQLNTHMAPEDLAALPYLHDDPNKPVPFLESGETPAMVLMSQQARMGEPALLRGAGLLNTTGTLPGVISPRSLELQCEELANQCLRLYPDNVYVQNQVRDILNRSREDPPAAYAMLRHICDQQHNQPQHQPQHQQPQHHQPRGLASESRGLGGPRDGPAEASRGLAGSAKPPTAVLHHNPQQVPPYYPSVRQRELSRHGISSQQKSEANRMLHEAQTLINQANAQLGTQQHMHQQDQQHMHQQDQQQMHQDQQLMHQDQQLMHQDHQHNHSHNRQSRNPKHNNTNASVPASSQQYLRGVPSRANAGGHSQMSSRRFDNNAPDTRRFSPSQNNNTQPKRRMGCQC